MSAGDREETSDHAAGSGPERPTFRVATAKVTVNGLGSSNELPTDNLQARAQQFEKMQAAESQQAAGPEPIAQKTRDQYPTNAYQVLNDEHSAHAIAAEVNTGGSGFFAKAASVLGAAAEQVSKSVESLFAPVEAPTPQQQIESAKGDQAADQAQGYAAKDAAQKQLSQEEKLQREVDLRMSRDYPAESAQEREAQQKRDRDDGNER